MPVAAAAKRPAPLSPEQIRALRLRLGLTVEEAAERMHVTTRTWYFWERGERFPLGPALLVLRSWLDPKN